MKKAHKIRKNWQFQEIINNKIQIVNKYLIFYYRKNNDKLKIGISVSKKFANAVKRNKYKRQVRYALDQINMWKLQYDIIVILRKEYLILSFNDKLLELKKMLERL